MVMPFCFNHAVCRWLAYRQRLSDTSAEHASGLSLSFTPSLDSVHIDSRLTFLAKRCPDYIPTHLLRSCHQNQNKRQVLFAGDKRSQYLL